MEERAIQPTEKKYFKIYSGEKIVDSHNLYLSKKLL